MYPVQSLWEKRPFIPSCCLSGEGHSQVTGSAPMTASPLQLAPGSHIFLQPPALHLCHAHTRPDNPEQRHWEHGQSSVMPSCGHHTRETNSPARSLQDVSYRGWLQTLLLSTYGDLPKRPPPCSSPLTRPHPTYRRVSMLDTIPVLLQKWLHNMCFCQPQETGPLDLGHLTHDHSTCNFFSFPCYLN